MSARIPAWKAIGLKLRNETGNDHELRHNGGLSSNKVHLVTPADEQATRPSKRRRYEASLEANDTRSNLNGSGNISTANGSPVVKRKKSVSFTNDTKYEDGDTRTTIDFPPGTQGPAASVQAKSTSLAQNTTDAIKSDADADAAKSPAKKTKKEKQARPKRNGAPIRKPQNALEYLNQFHTDRASWKFNKNQDSWILSHALSCDDIPTTYNHALCAYIHGLPAHAGARTRLTLRCKERLQTDSEGDNDSKQRGQYGDSLSEILGSTDPLKSSAKFKEWLSTESRPVLLLFAMGVNPVTAMRDASAVQNGNGTASTKPKKKKSRTLAAVDLSSSDESSSDESSTDDSTSDNDETSSSGSSSDSESE